MKIIESRYKIAFAPMYGYPSETAHEIRDLYQTDIEVVYGTNGRFSIRSAVPVSHLIAREFSGGGHPPAAGGTFTLTFIDKVSLFFLKKPAVSMNWFGLRMLFPDYIHPFSFSFFVHNS